MHKVTAVGFEPTQLALVELESTPLDHSGKLSVSRVHAYFLVSPRRCHFNTNAIREHICVVDFLKYMLARSAIV